MFRFLMLFILAGAVLEIASLIWVGGAIGLLPTLMLLLGGGVAGIWLLRSTGANAAAVLRSSLQDGKSHERLAGTTVVRILAAILLLVPGFFSDIVALLLLLLPVDWWIARKAARSVGAGSPKPGAGSPVGPVIEGEAIEITGEVDFESPDNGAGDDRSLALQGPDCHVSQS